MGHKDLDRYDKQLREQSLHALRLIQEAQGLMREAAEVIQQIREERNAGA